ncbi:MAG: S16 family serine protease [Akkermansiaceae bacterium]
MNLDPCPSNMVEMYMFASFTPTHLAALSSLALFSQDSSAQETITQAESLQQTQIKGLLVVKLDNGSFAGAASQMNATAVKKDSGFEIGFNQSVGTMMTKATTEVDKFIRVRHADKLPSGMRIEFSFADKYSPKDGPSAAVVCALMADSIISGKEIDPGFAATGDMTATGAVQPVGGVASKIKGAIRKKCTHVGIPEANKSSITDAYLLQGIKPLFQIQVFTLKTFEQASHLASVKRPGDVQKALDEFALVQSALQKNKKYIYNGKVRSKLRNIVKLTPNHLSARLLYLHSVKKAPKKLSLLGSLTGIDNAGGKLGSMLQDGSFMKPGSLGDDVLTDLVYELSRLRPMLDDRTRRYADSYLDIANFFKRHRDRNRINAQLSRELKTLVAAIGIERKKLLNNPEIREELMDN